MSQVHVENELKRYKRRVRQIAHMRLIDKAYPGKMRKTVVRQALPRESSGGAGERALKKKAAFGRRDSIPCPFRPFGPASPKGKPTREGFEAHTGLIDETYMGSLT
jgi:hypothetical protein